MIRPSTRVTRLSNRLVGQHDCIIHHDTKLTRGHEQDAKYSQFFHKNLFTNCNNLSMENRQIKLNKVLMVNEIRAN